MLPHLGPEIIAVMQAALNSAPNDSRSRPCLPFRKTDDRISPSMVLSFNPTYSNSRTVSVLNVWVHWRP